MSDEQNVTVKADRLKAIPREFLEIECRAALESNAELRAQLAEQERRLAAAEAMMSNFKDCDFKTDTHYVLITMRRDPPFTYYCHRMLIQRDFDTGMEYMTDGQCERKFTSLFDAYLALIAAGWLPEPKKGA